MRLGLGVHALEQAELADDVSQGAAIDKLHRVVMNAALGAHGMDRHDVRVMQERGSLRLGLEPLKLARVQRGGERQNLESDTTTQGKLLGLVNDAHATAADLPHDVEIAQHPKPWAGDVRGGRDDYPGSHGRMGERGHHLERG